jgi:Reversibly glycosylated polypeptide
MKILVVPTIRPERMEDWLRNWEQYLDCDMVVIVHDTKQSNLQLTSRKVQVIDHGYIDQLGVEEIIQTRSSSIRSLGFLWALQKGATEIATLDDDCYPIENETFGFFDQHRSNARYSQAASIVTDLTVRGTPYVRDQQVQGPINIGLWSNVPDIDACYTLANWDGSYYSARKSQVIHPVSQYVPMCGMNLWFRAHMTPSLWFPVLPYHACRMDDMWAGLICKKVCDMMGLPFVSGSPVIDHQRASDRFANLIAEAEGIAMHEHMWKRVFKINSECGVDVASTVLNICRSLKQDESPLPDLLKIYFPQWVLGLEKWVQITTKLLNEKH